VTSDRVIGLGSADTKGAIAATLTALDSVKPHNVGVLFSGDEERSGTCIRHFLTTEWAKVIQQAIVCEPTGRSVGVKHRGCVAYVAEVQGKGGHSSGADFMPRPIVTMAKLAVSLDELAHRRLDLGPPDMKGLCLNVASIEGGVAFNVVPNQAALTFSIRPAPGFDAESFEAEVLDHARRTGQNVQLRAVLNLVPFGNRNPEPFRKLLGHLPEREITVPFWTEAAMFIYCGLYIELKRDDVQLIRSKDATKITKDDYKLRKKGDWYDLHTEEQANMLGALRKEGYCAEFAVGFNEAVKLIDNYVKR